MTAHAARPTVECEVCKRRVPAWDATRGAMLRDALHEQIARDCPSWSPDAWICQDDLNKYRASYVERILAEERGELSALDREVVESLREQDIVSRNLAAEFETRRTFGERLADRVASFGGSWAFILSFLGVMAVWIAGNVLLMRRPFDPYPFILLNLCLSCLAALQAPVIMMSQNRQEMKDRLRAENDYRINLKAELEIRHLHAKLDQLISHQWERLLEIQRIQMELLEELSGKRGPKPPEGSAP
jgi:uncharacterized membrane protein